MTAGVGAKGVDRYGFDLSIAVVAYVLGAGQTQPKGRHSGGEAKVLSATRERHYCVGLHVASDEPALAALGLLVA